MAKDIIDEELRKLFENNLEIQDDPIYLRNHIRERIWYVVREYMHKYYTIITFNSPMGDDSAYFLRDKFGLLAEWNGVQGTRGITTLYLPKNVKIENKDILNELFNILNKINPIDGINDLFDKDSEITIEEQEEY